MPTNQDVLEAYRDIGSKRGTAKALGIPRTTVARMIKRAEVEIQGITPAHTVGNAEEVIERLISRQQKKDEAIELSRRQRITIKDDLPIVLAIFSDTHWGNNKTDYRQLVKDTEVVRDCPYCYTMTAGDYSENWIGKLGWIAREQSMTKDEEITLVEWWFKQLAGSLIAVCSGNHDNRTIVLSGYDHIRETIKGELLLYDQDQILFTLDHGGNEIRFKIRHRDQYKSILNPFHGAMRDIERGDANWDVYVSGHDHRMTAFGDYLHHDKPRKVVRLGTYKMDDRYGKAIGFAKSYGTGCAALVLAGGKVQGFHSVEMAIKFCGILRDGEESELQPGSSRG